MLGLALLLNLTTDMSRLLLEPDNCCRLEGEGEEVAKGEPVPVLGEDQHAHNPQHGGVASP